MFLILLFSVTTFRVDNYAESSSRQMSLHSRDLECGLSESKAYLHFLQPNISVSTGYNRDSAQSLETFCPRLTQLEVLSGIFQFCVLRRLYGETNTVLSLYTDRSRTTSLQKRCIERGTVSGNDDEKEFSYNS
jgi:hypothetical protein